MDNNSNTYILAFDFGATKIAGLVAERNSVDNTLKPIAFEKEFPQEEIFQKGKLINGKKFVYHIKSLCTKLENITDLSIKRAYICSPHISTDEFVIQKAYLKKKHDIELITTISRKEALGACIPSAKKREEGFLAIDFGASQTIYTLIDQGKEKDCKTIVWGGDAISNDLTDLGLSWAQAERLKIKLGNALKSLETTNRLIELPATKTGDPKTIESQELALVIEARIKDILRQFIPALMKKLMLQPLEAGIFITGGASKLKNLDHLLEGVSNLKVQSLNLEELLLDSNYSEELFQPKYAQLIGLINKGNRNCLEVKRKKKKEKKKQKNNVFSGLGAKVIGLFDETSDEI